jgi:hypothetical protein
VIWANLHSAVAFGLWLLAWWSLEGLVLALRRRDRQGAWRWFAAGATGLLALANPNGLDTPLYPVRIAKIIRDLGEFADLAHYAPPQLWHQPAVFLLVGLLVAAVWLARGRLRELPLAAWVGVATFLWLGLEGSRFGPEFALVVAPVTCWLLAPELVRRSSPWLLRAAALVACAAVVGGSLHSFDPRSLRHPVARDLPVEAAEFLARHQLETYRTFNHQNFGGYLGWRLGVSVYWDGRSEVFAPIFREIATMPLAEAHQRWGFETLVLTEYEWPSVGPQLEPAGWVPVYWDDRTIVAIRREGPLAHLAAAALPVTTGFGPIPGFDSGLEDPHWRGVLERELHLALAAAPGSLRARYYLSRIATFDGDHTTARRYLLEAHAIAHHPSIEAALASLPAGSPPD